MTQWHKAWQDRFCDTEIDFKDPQQYKPRRVDAMTPDQSMSIEFQHSAISAPSVWDRKHDYELNVEDTVWIVDGDDVVVHRTSSGIVQLEFSGNSKWKYQAFVEAYEYILLDVKGDIYRIRPGNVCNRMICFREGGRSISDIVDCLNTNPSKIWSLWVDTDYVKPMLRISQQGAGNGKTFGIWKEIAMDEDVDVEIIVTKQHSAKEVIYKELNDQRERNEIHIVNSGLAPHDDDEPDRDLCETYGRQYFIEYSHKTTGRKCMILIGTIDSFMSGLTKNKCDTGDYFEGLLKTICRDGPTKMNLTTGRVRYGGQSVVLNRRARLWIDEVQDLPTRYQDAVERLIRDSGINVVIVGDKIQSVGEAKNCLTEANDIQNSVIDVVVDAAFNVNRRIQVQGMAAEINKIVQFGKWGVPEISVVNESTLDVVDSSTVEIIDVPTVYAAGSGDVSDPAKYVDVIMEKVAYEVSTHGYGPKDFLFQFVVMKNNTVAPELETRLCEFFNELLGTPEDPYKKQAVLHKHQEGTAIDTSKSTNASRIMSIRSSKGDGRPVVFVLQMTQAALLLCSGGEMGLRYESHVHVAMTRAKRKIYVAMDPVNDDIRKRFADAGHTVFFPSISSSINIESITERMDLEKMIAQMKRNGVLDYDDMVVALDMDDTMNVVKSTTPIDWGYHCVKRSVYIQSAMAEIVYNASGTTNFPKSQLKAVLHTISNLPISNGLSPTSKFYNCLREFQNKRNDDIHYPLPHFPLCDMGTAKNQFLRHKNTISRAMARNKKRINGDIKTALTINNIYDAVVMRYQIDLTQNLVYRKMQEMELYDITDFFFGNNTSDPKEKMLLDEVGRIGELIHGALGSVLDRDDVEWHIEHGVGYGGETDDFNIRYSSNIIGNSSDRIYHLKFVSERNRLNHWTTLADIALERMVLRKPRGNGRGKNNTTRFRGKEIDTYVFDLHNRRCEHLDWSWDKSSGEFSDDLVQLVRNACVTKYSLDGGHLYDWTRHKLDEHKIDSLPGNPFDVLVTTDEIQDCRAAKFVKEYFNTMRSDSRSCEKPKLQNRLTDKRAFVEHYTEHMQRSLDVYFGITVPTSVEDDW